MKVARTIPTMKEIRGELPEPVGFVPTMGYLHEGHLSLVRRARGENRSVAVSIFVNPTQFGPQEDFETYPRDAERDLTLLRREGIDVVFVPEAEEMYPADFNSWVVVEGMTEMLEGASRPGHFRGVATVVAKLLNIVQPNRAYFGRKDAQQALVIEKMVNDLNMSPEIIVAPTVREPDGLAVSSRNVRLDPEERQAALVLWKSLSLAQQLRSGGEKSADRIRQQMIALIEGEPRALIDYVSIADPESLRELDEIDRPALVSLAVRIGKTRLIDNVILDGAS
ncbi:pantoate--beta-alanine ligase [Dehalococcoidia bacterium]|nr:pantoate--beta-alanine ligase [Dehalococcoidia bacterium]